MSKRKINNSCMGFEVDLEWGGIEDLLDEIDQKCYCDNNSLEWFDEYEEDNMDELNVKKNKLLEYISNLYGEYETMFSSLRETVPASNILKDERLFNDVRYRICVAFMDFSLVVGRSFSIEELDSYYLGVHDVESAINDVLDEIIILGDKDTLNELANELDLDSDYIESLKNSPDSILAHMYNKAEKAKGRTKFELYLESAGEIIRIINNYRVRGTCTPA